MNRHQRRLGRWTGQRAYSIRTRIKTQVYEQRSLVAVGVREHIPLEQGLRLPLMFSLMLVFYWSESIFH